MNEPVFKWVAQVRDYELDCQGIVNNATFINYLEQCRNDYGRANGIDYIKYHQAGFDFVVAAIDIKYRQPLSAGEAFYVTAELVAITEKRLHFKQEIFRQDQQKPAATAMIDIACVDRKTGKSGLPDTLLTQLLAINPQLAQQTAG